MNWIVITIGTALVLVLMTALVAPLFIDWTAYRTTIEANAQRVLGAQVSLEGEAELRLLPSPRVRLTNVRIGSETNPLLTADAVELDVELAPLVRREVRVRGLRITSPRATLSIGEEGGFVVPQGTIERSFTSFLDVDAISVESVTIVDGALRILDRPRGLIHEFGGIDLTGSARSLRGPFTASGSVTIAGAQRAVRLAGGTLEGGTMPLSARLEPGGESPAGPLIRFEGALVPRADAPSLRGELTVSKRQPVPFSLTGTVRANPLEISLTGGTIRYGEEEAALELGAAALYSFEDDEPVLASIEARQIDLDRIARALLAAERGEAEALAPSPREAAAPLAAHFAQALSALAAAPQGAPPVVAEIAIGTIVSGGQVVRDVSAAVTSVGDGLTIERVEALLPGETALEASGTLAETFRGTVRARAAQPALLARWWTGQAPFGGAIDPVLLEGDIETDGRALTAQRLTVRIGETSLSGRLAYRPATQDGPASLDLAVTAPRLDAADLTDVGALIAASGLRVEEMPEVSLDVLAEEVRLGGVAGSSLSIDATFAQGILNVDAISAADLAGARIFASGEIGLFDDPVGALEGTVVVEDAGALAQALGGLAPAGTADVLRRLAPTLAPADMRISLTGESASGAGALALRVTGRLAGTEVALRASGPSPSAGWRDAPVSVRLAANNADGAALLRQLGLPVTADAQAQEAAILINFDGSLSEGLEGRAEIDALGAFAGFEGRLGEDLRPQGALTLSARALEPLETAFGRPLPPLAPAEVSATLSPAEGSTPGALSVSPLRATLAGTTVTGDLRLTADALTGRLEVGEASLGALAALALGPASLSPPAEDTPAAWPTAVFTDPFLPPVPVDLEIAADRLAIGPQSLTGATFTLSAEGERLAISDLSARFGDGALTGALALERTTGAQANLSATLELQDAALGALAWRVGGEPVAEGRLSLAAQVAASGVTAADLAANLSGAGTLRIEETRIEGLNLAPFDSVVSRLAQSETAPTAQSVEAAVTAHLADGDLAAGSVSADLVIDGGTVRLTAITGEDALREAFANASVDLGALSLRSDWRLGAAATGDDDVAALLTFEGPLAAPVRRLDVAAFTAWLSLRQLEAQIRTVEQENQALEAEADRLDPQLPAPSPPPGSTSEPATPPSPRSPPQTIEDLIPANPDERSSAAPVRSFASAL